MKSDKTTFSGWLTDNCYLLFSVLAFLTFYYDVPSFIRPALFLIIVFLNIKSINTKLGSISLFVLLYFFAAFLSLTGTLVRPYPESFFLTDLYWAYLPIIFYFIGHQSSDVYPIFYKSSLLAFMFIFIVGFFFLIFPTERYITKTLEILNLHSHYTDESYMYARFASFLDSYHTSNLGVCSLCFGFGLLRLGSNNKYFVKILAIMAITISIIAIMLAQQRVAMFTSIIILVYFLISSFGKNKLWWIVAIAIFGVLLFIAFNFYLSFFGDDVFGHITERLSQHDSASLVSSRSNQWKEAIEGFYMEPLFGLGVGSGGHLAEEVGLKPYVTDGSYFKILLEGGIFSFIPFISVLLLSLTKSFIQRKKYFIEFPLLLFFSLSMIGANVIDMPYIIMFMWYIIGRINRIEKKVLLHNSYEGNN